MPELMSRVPGFGTSWGLPERDFVPHHVPAVKLPAVEARAKDSHVGVGGTGVTDLGTDGDPASRNTWRFVY